MNAALAIALLPGLAALVAVVRYLRSAAPQRFVLAALQPVLAVLLYLALTAVPPPRADRLVVVTEGATAAQLDALRTADLASVALPGAPRVPGIAAVPDLATALRARPGTTALRIVGDGLGARDLDAVRDLPVAFEPGDALRGVVALEVEPRVVAGRMVRVAGRVEGVPQARVELRDPSDAIVAGSAPGEDGTFVLGARTRQAGVAHYRLRVLDGTGAQVEALDLPVDVVESTPLQVGVLGGAPGPELKYLRRYLVDAGFALRSRIGVSPGIEVRDAPLALDPPSLAGLDVLVVDERAWLAAGAGERAAIAEATRDGLGLMLRATGPLPAAVASSWRELGVIHAADDMAVRARAAARGADAPPALTLLPIRATAPGAVALHFEDDALGWWLPFGAGRVALWRVVDTHRLVTAGHAARHAELWATAFERIARARGTALRGLETLARVGERAVLCGVAPEGGRVHDPDGEDTVLVATPHGAHGTCAAWWPRRAGWHAVRGDAAPSDASADAVAVRVFVHEREAAATLAAADRMRATARLAARQGALRATGDTNDRRVPWWALWFALASACWWLERRALARGPA